MKGLRSLGNLGNLVKQAQEMQKKVQTLQEEMANEKVSASAGGGLVTVTANGQQKIVSVEIDKDVVDPEDVEMLEDLVLVAVNEALGRAQELMNERMGQIAGNLNIPGLI